MRKIKIIQATNKENFVVYDSNAPHYFSNVENLKNADLKINEIVKTLGYYNPNDGGAATYKITNTLNENIHQEILNNKLYANLITEKNIVNAKQLGTSENFDNSILLNKAFKQYKTIFFPMGTYLINDSIKLNESNSMIGDNNAIFKTTQTTKPLICVNRYCNISNLKFNIEKGFNSNVFEISFKTLSPQKVVNVYNDSNIRINNIDFLFDLDINDIPNKKGNCFLISADIVDSNITYNGSGYYGIYISDIFVKGACFSVIKQFVHKECWLTGCHYNNFNIDSAPLYGFYGYKKDIIGTDGLDYQDGSMIYFSNWQMQCGKSKNMFAFSYGGKYLNNCLPWDWGYSINNEKPYSILYRTDYKELIDLGGLQLNIYDLVDIINKPDTINYYNFIDNYFHSNINLNKPLKNEYFPTFFKLTNNGLQNIINNGKYNIINFTEIITDNLYFENFENGIKSLKNQNRIIFIINLDYYSEKGGSIAIYKNNNRISQNSLKTGYDKINITQTFSANKNDVFDVRIFSEGNTQIPIQSDTLNNFSAIV